MMSRAAKTTFGYTAPVTASKAFTSQCSNRGDVDGWPGVPKSNVISNGVALSYRASRPVLQGARAGVRHAVDPDDKESVEIVTKRPVSNESLLGFQRRVPEHLVVLGREKSFREDRDPDIPSWISLTAMQRKGSRLHVGWVHRHG